MPAQTISVAQARNDFSDLLAQVELLQRRYVIARRGRPKAVLVSVEDLARLEALEQGAIPPPTTERDRAVQALEQAGLLRPVSDELASRYVRLGPQEREAVRRELAARHFEPPLSEQVIQDRAER
jgi:prevent-host-death family protein